MTRELGALATLLLLVVLAAACAADSGTAAEPLDPADWTTVTAAADGQTVRWWMYGGDQRVNAFVDEHVAPAAADLGVTIERVPLADTADALRRIRAARDAGREDGGVDLLWINGLNFAAGKAEGLWLRDWATRLPRADLVDWEDETIATDFGVAVEGQSSPWARAAFVFAHDTARLPEPPRTVRELLAWVQENPGAFTYPAPPDFTGSAFVRQVVQSLGEDEALAALADRLPQQWRDGAALPANEAELNQLFGDGQVDIAMSYDPTFVATGVAQGGFPPTTRPFTLEDGTLQNTSYVTVPSSARNAAGALVVADLLLDPALQAAMGDPEVWGMPTVLDPARLDPAQREALEEARGGPHVLDGLGARLTELPADRVEALDRRWREEVLR